MNNLRSCLAFVTLSALVALGRGETQLIARLQDGIDPAEVASSDGVILRDRTPNAPFALFAVRPTDDSASAQARLVADPRVVWAEDNVDMDAPETDTQKSGKGGSMSVIGDRAALQNRNFKALSQISFSPFLANSPGRAVRIAILDTGLSRLQTALWNKTDAFIDAVTPGGNANDTITGTDSNGNGVKDEGVGHGTMVAGIIDQVAPQVHFVIARVADSDGRASAWTLTQGLAFAVVSKAEVANISMGSSSRVAAMTDVAEWCETNGLLIVAAIGNASQNGAYYPARVSKVLCVSGLNSDNTKATFSNWDGACSGAAPAVGIASQWWDGNIAVWSGTSFAAPFVSGAIADCLRRTGPVAPRSFLKLVNVSGTNIDKVNGAYKKMLGTLLNIVRLDGSLRHP